nr:RagB/SusD family nutrient uptake outer membrane protein [Saprospiraceae bacterium]
MRNIILAATIIFFSSCSEDFLDRKPTGTLTAETFFENEEHAILATNAIYSNFRSWEYCGLPYIGATDIISDDADKGSTENDGPYLKEVDDFFFDATNQTFSTIWKGHYQTISRANIAINRIPDIDMTASLKERLVGEAKFLRAFNYFRLVQWFGDIPLVTTQLTEDQFFTQKRNAKSEIYALIEQDLKDAISSLPEKSKYATNDLGRATKGAAKGILAKLYMVQKKYAEALVLCDEIIASGEYSLIPNYNQIFTRASEFGPESMFEIGAV